LPIIESIKVSGITTVRGIADELNRRGISTMHGRRWSATQVFRIIRVSARTGPPLALSQSAIRVPTARRSWALTDDVHCP
jgi:hypothetical protein